jgi:hypothetical protein
MRLLGGVLSSKLILVANLFEGMSLGSLTHEAGKGRLTGWRERGAGEPRTDAQEIDGDRA